MKKVVYSIKKVRGNSDDKISGLGFLNEEGTLLTYKNTNTAGLFITLRKIPLKALSIR